MTAEEFTKSIRTEHPIRGVGAWETRENDQNKDNIILLGNMWGEVRFERPRNPVGSFYHSTAREIHVGLKSMDGICRINMQFWRKMDGVESKERVQTISRRGMNHGWGQAKKTGGSVSK